MKTWPRATFSSAVVGWAIISLFLLVVFAAPASAWGVALPALIAVAALIIPPVLIVALDVPELGILTFFVLGIFQNFAMGIISGPMLTDDAVLQLVAFTTVFGATLVITNLLARDARATILREWEVLTVTIAYVVVIGVSTVISPAPWSARVPAVRNALSFLLLFYLGLSIPRMTPERIDRLLRSIWILIASVLVFGYLERFVLGDRFWVRYVFLDRIAEAKHLIPTAVSPYPVPADFYSPVAGTYLRRIASFFGTPITMGYFTAFSCFLAWYEILRRRSYNRIVWTAIFFILLITLAITFVKGAYLIVLVGAIAAVTIILGMRLRWRFRSVLLLWMLISLPIIVVGLFIFPESTAFVHLYGLTKTIIDLIGGPILFGHGAGTGGTISALLGANVQITEANGAESGIGSLIYQFGFVGISLYIAFQLIVARQLYRYASVERANSSGGAWLTLASLAAFLGLFANSFLQENALAPIPISTFLIFSGIALQQPFVDSVQARQEK